MKKPDNRTDFSIASIYKVPPKIDGTKYDGDKVRTDLLSSVAVIEICKVLTFGAKKYDAHNWRKGMDWSRLIGASLRHLFAYMAGEDNDPESGLSHLAHAGCCIWFLLEYSVTKTGTDDRYKVAVKGE